MTKKSTKVKRSIQSLNKIMYLCWILNMEKDVNKLESVRRSLIKKKNNLETLML